jgi:adenylate kinase family enzyme
MLYRMNFQRIYITGNAGAGKSTLAKRLGEIFDRPFIGLDKIVWQSGWHKTPSHIRIKKEEEIAKQAEWIVEGVSTRFQESSDLLIFLDYSRHVCLWRCFKRNWKYLFSSRPDLPPGCPELLIIPKLIKIIWSFQSAVRPDILKELKNKTKWTVHIQNESDLTTFLEEVITRYNNTLDRSDEARTFFAADLLPASPPRSA